ACSSSHHPDRRPRESDREGRRTRAPRSPRARRPGVRASVGPRSLTSSGDWPWTGPAIAGSSSPSPRGRRSGPRAAPHSSPASVQPPIKRVGGPKLKTSLNAYSFSKPLNDQIKGRAKGISLFDLLDFCAEQDFDALDPTGYFFPGYPKVPSDRYINDFKRKAF